MLLETSEDGYIILNKEAIPAILKTKEEPEQTVKNEEESDSSDGLVESESGSEDCVEVVFPPKGVKRDGEENESNRKIIEIEWCFCYNKLMADDFECLKKLILSRQSVRVFNGQPLEPGVLETILGYALVKLLWID